MDYNNFNIPRSYILFATTSIAVVSALFSVYWYQRKRKSYRRPPPKNWEAVGNITELFIYPLKSGRRIPATRVECTQYGFKQTTDDEKVYQLRDR